MKSKMKFLGLLLLSVALVIPFTSCEEDKEDKEDDGQGKPTYVPGYEQDIQGSYAGGVASLDSSIVIPDVTLGITAADSTNKASVSTTLDLSPLGFGSLTVDGPVIVSLSNDEDGYAINGIVIAPLKVESYPISIPIPVDLNGTIVGGKANITISVLLSMLPPESGLGSNNIDLKFVGETTSAPIK
ncbi:MAG: hypothetical protein EZS26_002588 [Candidatus Ordinivivax streblomastigis]|uniref:Uncharacterized protein n=1 Tax=Candidatus Ordinivivax streblomastigis TaxID=2540710 RepID=A0A5M8NYT8_9BACT|nr:MAG: hypothetical protein EZS26_002588 [Candidatus Ordinivivax streblomastigis]